MSELYRFKPMPIYVDLPIYIKNLKTTMYMRISEIEDHNNVYRTKPPQSTIYINISKSHGNYSGNKSSFPIKWDSIGKFKRSMEAVKLWYSEPYIHQIYSRVKDGDIMLNAGHKTFEVTIKVSDTKSNYGLILKPTLLDTPTGNTEPGCILYVNDAENYIVMTEGDINRFCEYFISFNFHQFEQNMLNSLMYSMMCNNVISNSEVMRRNQNKKMGIYI